MRDYLFDIRRVLSNRIDHCITKLLTLLVPCPFLHVVGRVLHKTRHHIFSRRRYRRVSQTRYHHVDVWTPREATILCFIVRTLHVIDARRNRNLSAQMSARPGNRVEIRETVEREIYLTRRAAVLVTFQIVAEIVRQVFLTNHLHERQTWIDTRRDDISLDFVTIVQHYAGRASVLDQDLRNWRLSAYLDASFTGRVGNRV